MQEFPLQPRSTSPAMRSPWSCSFTSFFRPSSTTQTFGTPPSKPSLTTACCLIERYNTDAIFSLPLLSSGTFDNTGKSYNITRVVDANLNFVLEKYEAYSPMYISMSYSLTYGLSFAAVSSIIVYTYLYNGADIWAKLKNSRHGGEDIHKRLMNAYKEVPDWWYGILTVAVLGLGIFTVRYWDSGLPVWGFIVVCFGMGVVLIVPEGILEGTTNQRMSVVPNFLSLLFH